MTTPVPALSTSADVEAVLRRVRAYCNAVPTLYDDDNPMHPELVLDTVTDWTNLNETERGEGRRGVILTPHHDLTYADLIALVAALPTPPTEGTGVTSVEDGCTCGGMAACPQCQDRDATPSVPGAVGAGSAVEALADRWEQDAQDGMSYVFATRAKELRAAIAQDADRTSRGGALGEALATIRAAMDECFEPDIGGVDWPNDAAIQTMAAKVYRALTLAARATRPAPEPPTPGACDCGTIDGGHPGDCAIFTRPGRPGRGYPGTSLAATRRVR